MTLEKQIESLRIGTVPMMQNEVEQFLKIANTHAEKFAHFMIVENGAKQAKKFFLQLLNANAEYIALENPTPSKIHELPNYNQAIQPWMFGHKYTKRTCLWLKNLPKLIPNINEKPNGITPYVNGGCKDANGNYRKAQGRNERCPIQRSKTFEGIAEAMAAQWSDFILNDKRSNCTQRSAASRQLRTSELFIFC